VCYLAAHRHLVRSRQKKPPIDARALRLFGKGGILVPIMHELLEPAFVPVAPRQIPLGETGLTMETTSSIGETAAVIRGPVPGVNPLKYTDPDGNKLNYAQYAPMRRYMELLNHGETGKQILKKNVDIVVTRNYYEGMKIDGSKYYNDKLSIRVFEKEINNIQVQSTVDWTSRYDMSETSENYILFDAEIGVSGKTNTLIQDTILIDKKKGNFLHGPSKNKGRPFSGGCVITVTKKDEREVMTILREYLGFKNGETITVRFVQSIEEPAKNLE
jgi:hypothetical protein